MPKKTELPETAKILNENQGSNFDRTKPHFLSERVVDDKDSLFEMILEFAKAQWADPTVRSIFARAKTTDEFTDDEITRLDNFRFEYFSRLNRPPPLSATVTTALLRQVASGTLTDLEDPRFISYLKKYCTMD